MLFFSFFFFFQSPAFKLAFFILMYVFQHERMDKTGNKSFKTPVGISDCAYLDSKRLSVLSFVLSRRQKTALQYALSINNNYNNKKIIN